MEKRERNSYFKEQKCFELSFKELSLALYLEKLSKKAFAQLKLPKKEFRR
jgi:hypothetical protein